MKHLIFIALVVVLVPVSALGNDAAAYEAYGLLIGSNRAATGQTHLSYAHRDARRMEQTLKDVSGFVDENLTLLIDPDRSQVESAIDDVARILQEKAQLDEKTVFLFYYSGHARSSGLNLGANDFPLSELKARLRTLPATVTVVLLDACQSGAISNVKGVGTAAPDQVFSYNSVDQLNVSGMAVIASSSGSELSQESDKLRGSYFSHHFTVGLRGAADADENGVVTLAEAYNYAYNQTLSTTALTAVGRQHATLEMNLKGKGDMPMAWPSKSRAALKIRSGFEGEILLTHRKSGTVAAEIRKVKGHAFSVALTPGGYEALVTLSDRKAYQCLIEIAREEVQILDLYRCTPLALEDQTAKGSALVYRVTGKERPRRREYLMMELQFGYFGAGDSPYTRRLEDFQYKGLDESKAFGMGVAVVGTPLPFLSAGVEFATMDRREGVSGLMSHDQEVSWQSYRVGGFVRGNLILGSAMFVPYAQVGAGYAFAKFSYEYDNGTSVGVDASDFSGPYFTGALGIQMNPTRLFGITLAQLSYTRAHLVEMTEPGFDEQHDNGGISVFTGIRVGY
jgi:uncharacterized caspase-like protein